MQPKLNIAIDGYSSCGKSTLAIGLAHQLGYIYIDTGAMYRAVTLYCLDSGIDTMDPIKVITTLPDIDIHFDWLENSIHTYLNGVNVEEKIREMRVSNKVSEVSAIPEVREKMVALQRKYGEQGGVVMDGRDIGTVVFPDARIKIFMTADREIRARRRLQELEGKGKSSSLAEVLQNLTHRDYLDTTRDASPLKKAEDAIVLDNSNLSENQQMIWALNLVDARLSND